MAAKRIELNEKVIVTQYQSGLPIKTIARINCVSEDTISSRLKKLGYELTNPFLRKFSKERLSNVYIDKGMSIELIAKKYNVSYETVREALKKYMIPIKGVQRKVNRNETTTRINCEKV